MISIKIADIEPVGTSNEREGEREKEIETDRERGRLWEAGEKRGRRKHAEK